MDEMKSESVDVPSRPAADASVAEAVSAATESMDTTANDGPGDGDADGDDGLDGEPGVRPVRKRRRGSRGGRGRARPAGSADGDGDDEDDDLDDGPDGGDEAAESDADGGPPRTTPKPVKAAADKAAAAPRAPRPAIAPPPRPAKATGEKAPAAPKAPRAPRAAQPELPERISEGRASGEAAEAALVRRPQIGDTRPAIAPPSRPAESADTEAGGAKKKRRRSGTGAAAGAAAGAGPSGARSRTSAPAASGGSGRGSSAQLDPDVLEKRRGRERNGRPIGRYLMCVQVRDNLTQVAVMEGRNLVEHYVSRPADDIGQIHGNIYVGKVQNVLPGMEAAFVDIATPKNAVLYRGDVQYDQEDIVERGSGGSAKDARIEQILKAKQLIVCQVTKNPIGAKGARLTQEVSLPGRFVVLIPNSKTYGISKRLPDDVRKRLRNILDRVKPAEHGLIVRTAAENASEHELRADMTRLLETWNQIEAKAKKMQSPGLLYREPELAVRVIREEFNSEYRGVVIDDKRLFEDVHSYISAFNPELADRVEFYDPDEEGLPIYERFHLHEQLHKALDRKVWLPSGGSLIIEHTEALSVIDVNTGKNVGTSNSNLEATVFHNNLEAADEIARQLRLRDIGGIIVIDFIDMEIRENRRKVVDAFKEALARDKTRTQVFDITELGLVEMTRKRIGEGLLTNFADQCPNCEGRGVVVDLAMLD
ncbi:MAG: ribonuclease [Ilumatobacteraceae bacterium]|nr:ribonuclease [Ilumatobacteraceae bacterium]